MKLNSRFDLRHFLQFSSLAVIALVICSSWTLTAFAQNTIQTVAGGGVVSGVATTADIAGPSSVARDAAGNTYITGPAQNQIFKVDTSGNITVFAGIGYSTEDPQKLDGGPAVSGSFNNPVGVTADTLGNVYVADTTDYLIRQIDASGNIHTAAGNAHQCQDPTALCGDRQIAQAAQLASPTAVATDKAGNIYIADTGDNRIRVVNVGKVSVKIAGKWIAAGVINTIAGNGTPCSSPTLPCGDGGPAISANLNGPNGVAVDKAGNVYIADSGDRRIRIVNAAGVISAYAGTGVNCVVSTGCGDGGPATSATLSSPWQISLDTAGDLFISDPPESRIREVLANGTMASYAGTGVRGFAGNGGLALSAQLNAPHGVWADASGNIIIGDTGNQLVRAINPTTQFISSFAGGGLGDSPVATSGILAGDRATAVDTVGNVYIADTANNRIRKITVGGAISTVAGTGIATYSGDGGLATAATLSGPEGVGVDANGNIFIADTGNLVVREVNISTGIITTVAGTGKSCPPQGACGDGGAATSATFTFPTTVEVDNTGAFYIADQRANRVRWVDTTGVIHPFAGTGAACTNPANGQCGDGGPATQALLYGPFSALPDNAGNVYIADTFDNRVRKVDSAGIIHAYAFNGNGIVWGPNKGAALQFAFNTPQDLAIDAGGSLYVAGSGLFYTIERIDALSPGNLTVAISGKTGDPKYYGFSGDGGPAIGAELNNFGASIDGSGHLFVADGGNNRVREISITSAATIAPSSLIFPAQAIGTTSAPKTFKLTNLGSNVLNISSMVASGDFALTPSQPCANNQVPPGFSCTVSVTFTPTTYGTRSGKVIISDDAYQDPTQTVFLSGSATDYTITANPNSLTVTHGNQATSTITLTPVAGFNQTVNLTCTGFPKNSTCGIVPNSITLDGTDAATATLTITTTANTLPGSYPLKANGVSVINHSAAIALTVQ
jgi:NHL repeat